MLLLAVFAAAACSVHALERSELIDIVNRANTTWRAGVNARFAGLPIGVSASLCGVKNTSRIELVALVASGVVGTPSREYLSAVEPPAEFDAATAWPACAEVIGDIRDQSDCGCCWAFGAAEAASDRLCIATNASIKLPLSAEDVCFCSMDEVKPRDGCGGGELYTPWSYIKTSGAVTGGQFNGSGPLGSAFCSDFSLPHCHHHGPQGSDPYPAEGTTGCPVVAAWESPRCPTACNNAHTNRSYATDKYGFKGTVNMYPHDEKDIRAAIMQHGPVEAAFNVYADFENYVSGVYQHVTGAQVGGHAIKIVGWGTENGTDYWKVANSWNPFWGEKGYFRIIRGAAGQAGCGIEDQVTASGPDVTWGKMSDLA